MAATRQVVCLEGGKQAAGGAHQGYGEGWKDEGRMKNRHHEFRQATGDVSDYGRSVEPNHADGGSCEQRYEGAGGVPKPKPRWNLQRLTLSLQLGFMAHQQA